ncbi:MAG: acyl-CoA dehydrogenase family protein [Planctomycetota bacterium]|nr:acyl-CoA dehydrogenase family protein [Planctomycetota bacterium]
MPMAYRAPDFFDLDEMLTEEERLVRDTVRDWVSDRFMPVIAEAYRKGTFPEHLIPEMAELGVLGGNLDYGDFPRLGPVAYGLVMQELERGDSGLRSFVSVQGALVMYPIWRYGSDEQKDKWLPKLHDGSAIGCFGLTEPDHGSDPGGMETKAVATDDGYVLNGAKMWITNGNLADVAVVWAKLDGEIRGFLVEKGMDGFEVMEQRAKHSLRASVTSELSFQDVKLGKDALLPGAKGLGGPLSCLNQARYGIAWGAIGAAMACYDEALEYGKSRTQFGKPIAQFQLYQNKLTHMITEITKGQMMNLRLGRLKEQGTVTPFQVSMAKRNGCFHALEIARMARDMLGANGITDEYQAMRHMCNLESVKTYEGTHDIHTLIVGREITGLDAFA